MTEERFWGLVEQARDGDSSASPDQMAEILTPLSDEDVSDFGALFYSKVCDLNQWRLWGAGYVIAGGMSDDSFHYFRSWIVGKGRSVFEIALNNPDGLGSFVDDPDVNNELLEYVAVEILERRGKQEDPRDRSVRRADGQPTGEPFDEETVGDDFPRLTSQFG
jgi:hypothetical protein